MIKKIHLFIISVVSVATIFLSSIYTQVETKPTEKSRAEKYVYLPGNVANGIKDLDSIYKALTTYRVRHQGMYPQKMVQLGIDIGTNAKEYGFSDPLSVRNELSNPDAQYSDNPSYRESPEVTIPYLLDGNRFDGAKVGSPKLIGTRDALAYAYLYRYEQERSKGSRQKFNPRGYYLVLWDDGGVEKVPFDNVLNVYDGQGFKYAFRGQAGVMSNIVTYEESAWLTSKGKQVLIGKPLVEGSLISDNGAPESLVALSRLMNFPDRNGIEREKLWQTFSPSQETFTLKQTLESTAKLGLPLQQKKLTLAQLQKLNTPAIVQQNDKSIVTLAQAGIEYSIVQDQGMTRIVRSEQLAALLNGEVLIPQTVTTALPLRADNPVRVVPMKTTNDSSVQTITLTNDGKTPINLEIERPIPGVTQAQLSSKTLAPGASATLTLTLKWREILPGNTQNVYVTLRTDNPQQPRLMMGFQLNLPAVPPVSATPSGTPPELP